MANLFEGEFKAVGVKESLQSKEGKAGGKGPEISAQFKVQEGEKGTDDRGKEVSVGNKTLTWYATLTENTRGRIEEGLKNFGGPVFFVPVPRGTELPGPRPRPTEGTDGRDGSDDGVHGAPW